MNRDLEAWTNLEEDARHYKIVRPRLTISDKIGTSKGSYMHGENKYVISDNTDSLCTVSNNSIIVRLGKYTT